MDAFDGSNVVGRRGVLESILKKDKPSVAWPTKAITRSLANPLLLAALPPMESRWWPTRPHGWSWLAGLLAS